MRFFPVNNRYRMVRVLTFLLASAALCCLLAADTLAAGRPNILWLSIEDAGTQLGAYGDNQAVTPNLDRLAAAGVRFDRAYATAPVCAVARSSLITGIYSVAQGSQFMRTDIVVPEQVRPFPALMREAGYFTTNRSKTDYQFETPEGVWDRQGDGHRDWNERPDPAQPFFSVINFTGTHESQNRGEYDAQLFDPAKLKIPPYYPDTPEVRRLWASYYQNIHEADLWVAQQLERLRKDGLDEDTIVVFWSDHGVGFPRAKRWIYDAGLHVAMIAHVPEKWRDRIPLGALNGASPELVSFIDFAPTMLSLAGAERPDYLQGRVFMGPDREPAPEYLFGHRDRMDETIDIIRALTGQRYKYIRNFEPFKPYLHYVEYAEVNAWNGMTRAIRQAHAEGGNAVADWYFKSKPVEELYDLENDPHETNNLAADPAHAETMKAMRTALFAEQRRIGDLGSIPEPLLREWRETYGSEYAIRTEHRHLLDAAWAILRNLHLLSVDGFSDYILDDNAAVRYWAAIGLGNRATDSGARVRIEQSLVYLLGDPETIVRIAAARSLLLIDDSVQGLAILSAVLENTDIHWTYHLAALHALAEAGLRAQPIRDVIAAAKLDKFSDFVRQQILKNLD